MLSSTERARAPPSVVEDPLLFHRWGSCVVLRSHWISAASTKSQNVQERVDQCHPHKKLDRTTACMWATLSLSGMDREESWLKVISGSTLAKFFTQTRGRNHSREGLRRRRRKTHTSLNKTLFETPVSGPTPRTFSRTTRKTCPENALSSCHTSAANRNQIMADVDRNCPSLDKHRHE